MGKHITFDIEASGLLDESSIDYTASPYVLKPTFKNHCVVVEVHGTGELIAFYDGYKYIFDGRRYEETDGIYTYVLDDYDPIEYEKRPLSEFPSYLKSGEVSRVVGHNIVNYDLLVSKLCYEDMDYTVDPIDTIGGVEIEIVDTMILSKVLNPDRFGGHSLEKLAKSAGGVLKWDFRRDVPKADRFKTKAADMIYYCMMDNRATTSVYKYLEKERDGLDLSRPLATEKAVAEIITRQEHRGFAFDMDLARKSVAELDTLMDECRTRVQPYLPDRPPTKKFLQEHTPPTSQLKIDSITPPKLQFKKNGSLSNNMLKFIDKISGRYDVDKECVYTENDQQCYKLPIPSDKEFVLSISPSDNLLKFIEKHDAKLSEDLSTIKIFGETHALPLPKEPLKTKRKGDIEDSTAIKQWLVSLGWDAQEYKDKDLSVNSDKSKGRRTEEQIEVAVERYVEETLNSAFCDQRLEILEANRKNLKRKLMRQAIRRSCKVPTSPSFTIGQAKDIDPHLEIISKDFPHVKDVVNYHTYSHRRNSILGGGVEWQDVEKEAEKGYIANVREDGRIATPAATCDASTGRMKHRVVANIPRVKSLYGANMRGLFGVSKGYVQSGYDFDSLEARIEGHYCWPYDDTKEYCKNLDLPKPMDVHSRLAKVISNIIGEEFERDSAKSVKYSATFGAQAPRIAKGIGSDIETGQLVFDMFWKEAYPLKKLKDALTDYWKTTGKRKHILGLDGRHIPTRAEHVLLNCLLQSGGVICAKQTMVFHDRLLKKHGLSVDFFKDDWRNKSYMQQLIAYHDEAQLEEKVGNYSFKFFDKKEEAEEYRLSPEDGRVWSEPVKAKRGGYVIGTSKACELISQAVEMTNKHFNLNVPLSASFILGKSWKDCH